MSEAGEKQFDPTPRRLKKAREEGNVFHSREVVSVVSLFAGGAVLAFLAPATMDALKALWERLFLQAASTPVTYGSIPMLMTDIGLELTVLLAPLLLCLMLVGAGLNVLQSGWGVTAKPLAPKGSRINPGAGFKRIFSKKGAFELVKTLVKMALVGPIAYNVIEGYLPEILMLHTLSLEDAFANAGGWIASLVSQILMALLVLAAADFFFEKRRHTEELKMTRQEVMDESKEQEGDPHIKGKRRQMARQMLNKPRMDHAILKADVVITNPTHYAIALRYDPADGDAPRVLLKGIRKRALRIKELAAQHGIPMIENRPLARALYASVEEDSPIPEELYPAVAAILAEVYRNRAKR